MKKYFIYSLILCGVIIAIFLLTQNIFKSALPELSVASSANATIKPFTILIVPGHDTDTGGASFKNVYERNLVVDLADNISTLLDNNPKYKIIVARDKQVWNPIFADYFINNQQAIIDFKNQHQANYKLLTDSGQKKIIHDAATHSTVDQKTAIELYGINKWADENDVNLIVHLHFNSSPRKNMNLPGPYHGFNIFIPEKQRVNNATSRNIAERIYKELEKKFTPETSGNNYSSLFEDQGLIALGASDTLTKPAILIEYAYVYEKMLIINTSQKQAIEQMAEQTVLGIQNYFN